MGNCYQYTIKCLVEGIGVYKYTPTTTTTLDNICYLVDCNGNFIVDCQCNNIVGCPCPSITSSTTTTTFVPLSSTTTSTSSTTTTRPSSTTSTSSTSTTTTFSGSTTTTTTLGPDALLPVPRGANLNSFGDSITNTNYVSPTSHYTTLLANDLGVSVTRYAVGNSGFKTLMSNSNLNIVPNTNIVTELTGLNNVYYEGGKSNITPIIGHGLLTFFANQWASSIVNGANASIAKTGGTFTGYGANTNVICGKYGLASGGTIPNNTDAIYTNSAGAYIEYTAVFKEAIIGMIGSNGQFSYPSGTVNIYLDNVLQTTINLGQQYPTPWAGPGSGFGPDYEAVGPVMCNVSANTLASHTIKIELVSGDMALDYISLLAQPANCYPIVSGEIPYVDPSQWGAGSQILAASYSTIKQNYVNLYKNKGYPVRYCVINSPAGPYSYVNTVDGTHPNVLGNQQIATAFQALFV